MIMRTPNFGVQSLKKPVRFSRNPQFPLSMNFSAEQKSSTKRGMSTKGGATKSCGDSLK